MEQFISLAIGAAIFLVGFMLGAFIEGIRSRVLRVEQQQYINHQVQAVTKTNIPAYNETTRELQEYRDEY